MAAEPGIRLFFALAPPDTVRTQLSLHAERLAARVPDARRIPAENYHLTVCFVGTVGRVERDALASWTGDFVCPQFSLQLNETGVFRRAGVVWAGCQAPPQALHAVRAATVPQAAQAGATTQDLDATRFRPHVSLLRAPGSLGPAEKFVPLAPVDWSVSRLVLMVSEPIRRGVRYRIVAESRLAMG